eukprot:TRINITY_DN91639_c0_g1_i1.p1 TRINITY_DN91639_c0_g1~~TRINITY_DN91639_c0_g1_i1.p1  ORF type:complete len:704 (-),score=133.74 TRINITY_DN91639_c0_g1_i1:57-2168(-)
MPEGSLSDLQQVAGNQFRSSADHSPPLQKASRNKDTSHQKQVRSEASGAIRHSDPVAAVLVPWCERIDTILQQRNRELLERVETTLQAHYRGQRSRSCTWDDALDALAFGSEEVNSPKSPTSPKLERWKTVSTEGGLMLANKRQCIDENELEELALRKSEERLIRQQTQLPGEMPEVQEPTAWRRCRQRLQELVASHQFESLSAVLILTNSALIGVQVQMLADSGYAQEGLSADIFFGVHQTYAFAFLVELILRIVAQGRLFWWGSDKASLLWNYFDLLLVISGTLEAAVEMSLAVTNQRQTQTEDVSFSHKVRIVRTLRVTRLLRTMRAVRFIRGLRSLVYSIFYTLKALVWSLVLLIMIIYLFGIFFADSVNSYLASRKELDEDTEEALKLYFGSLHVSMHTLFASISGGIDWGKALRVLIQIDWTFAYIFEAYIAFVCFAVLNVMTGVFCQRAMDMADQDQESAVMVVKLEQDRLADWASDLFKRFDPDTEGNVTFGGFEKAFQDEQVKETLQALDISPDEVWDLFKLLDTGKSGDISEQEFVDGVMRLRGGAKSLDMALLVEENRQIKLKISDFEEQRDSMNRLESQIRFLVKSIQAIPKAMAEQEKQEEHMTKMKQMSQEPKHVAALVPLLQARPLVQVEEPAPPLSCSSAPQAPACAPPALGEPGRLHFTEDVHFFGGPVLSANQDESFIQMPGRPT